MHGLPINVDVGEGDEVIDQALLPLVDQMNIALGGHAGDPGWSRELAAMAAATGVRVHLHPGYADPDHFGRRQLDLPWAELAASLDLQRAVLPDVTICKFHGALYNQAAVHPALAEQLVAWAASSGIDRLLAPPDSCLQSAAVVAGLACEAEGFVDRRYVLDRAGLQLVPRDDGRALITALADIIGQAEQIATEGQVRCVDGHLHALPCQTLCMHGDAVDALAVAEALFAWRHG